MEIKEITSPQVWDRFIVEQEDYTFLQSWAWGQFNLLRKEKAWRLGVFENDKLVGVCLAISVNAKRGRFLFVPHGPVLADARSSIFGLVIDHLRDICIQNGFSFLRISPWMKANEVNKTMFVKKGFRNSPTLMHTEETWLVDLNKPEDQQFSEMRKTTRNLIRRGLKDGVGVITSTNVQDVTYLYDLQMETVKRHGFVPFSKSYLETEIAVFRENDQCLLFLGSFERKVVSAAIIIFFGRMAFYFQSGSRETTAPVSYVLQWEVIKTARKRGCAVYNLWGVAPEGNSGHPWSGLTMFKSGFGGYRQNYLHAQDLIIKPRYWLTWVIEKVPRAWRSRLNKV